MIGSNRGGGRRSSSSRFRRGGSSRGGGELPSPSDGLPTSRPSFNDSDGSDIENQMEDNASTTTDNKRKSTSSPPGSAESVLGRILRLDRSPPGSAESDLGRLLWTAGRKFRDTKRSVSKPARELRDLLFSDKLEKKIEEIKQKHKKGRFKKGKVDENDLVYALERIILLYVPILKTCTNDKDLYHYYYRFRKSVQAALEKVGAAGLINMGEDLSEETLLLLTLHYATDSEKNNITGTDNLSKMKRNKSSCIDFAWLMLPSSLFREYFRSCFEKGEDPPSPSQLEEDFGEAPIADSTSSEPAALEDSPEDGDTQPEDTSETQAAAGGNGEASPNTSQHEKKARAHWNKVLKYITKRITLLDFRFVISKDKDTFQQELKELVGSDNMHLLDIIGAMNVGFHNLYYHLRTGGGRLPNIIMSTHIWNIVFSLCDPDYQAKAAQLCGYLPHPECFLAGYIRDVLVYDDDLVNYFDSVIVAGFAEIFRQVFGVNDYSSTVARRFNRGLLTDEEVAALKKLLRAIRIKGGMTNGKMRQFIKAIMDCLSKDTNIDTEEDAFDLLPGILRRLRARHVLEATEGADEMMDDEGKEEEMEEEVEEEDEEDADDGDVDGIDYSVYVDACYGAYKALIEQCDKKSRENIYKLVAKLQSLYLGSKLGGIRGGKTAGLMQTLASAMLEQFGSDGLDDTILDKLESLHQQYKSSLNNDGSDSDSHHSSSEFDDTVREAYLALITHKPSISDDFSSLVSLIRYHALNDEATFQQNLDKLEEYIEDNFNKTNGRFAGSKVKFVYSMKADGSFDTLSQWWSAVIGYATYLRVVPKYKKASGEQLTKLREILGNNFDNYEAIDAAIEAAKTQKHEKRDTAATKKKKSLSKLKNLFG